MAEIEPQEEEVIADVEEDETVESAEEETNTDVKTDDDDDTDGDVIADTNTPEDKPVPPAPTKVVEPAAEEEPVKQQSKKIDFEITNPDDIDIDDKGQLGLF